MRYLVTFFLPKTARYLAIFNYFKKRKQLFIFFCINIENLLENISHFHFGYSLKIKCYIQQNMKSFHVEGADLEQVPNKKRLVIHLLKKRQKDKKKGHEIIRKFFGLGSVKALFILATP